MGCGSSGQIVAPAEPAEQMANGVNGVDHNNDVPTVILPETPQKPKPPIAFEIPIEEFEGNRKITTLPLHVQRLLQPPSAEISLPDIEEKLAEAEHRRKSILLQRALSAQKRTQKILKEMSGTDRILIGHAPEEKHGSNLLNITPQPGACDDKNIS